MRPLVSPVFLALLSCRFICLDSLRFSLAFDFFCLVGTLSVRVRIVHLRSVELYRVTLVVRAPILVLVRAPVCFLTYDYLYSF